MNVAASTLDLPIYGASDHAVARMLERYGLTLDNDTWTSIVAHARAGYYAEMPGRWPSISGAVRAYAVPMGTSEADMVVVPVVVNLDTGTVVTVLPE